MENGHGPQVYSPVPVINYSNGMNNSDNGWRNFIFVVVGILFAIGASYLSYVLCLKDLLLTLKAKRQKTTTEIGFGQTPVRPGVNGNNGNGGLS